jgi:hypothetical protein
MPKPVTPGVAHADRCVAVQLLAEGAINSVWLREFECALDHLRSEKDSVFL